MAITFASASSEYASSNNPAVSGPYPVTIAAWFRLASTGADQAICGLSVDSNSYLLLRVNSSNKAQARSAAADATTNGATSTTALTSGTWYHATAIFAGDADRRIIVSNGDDVSNTNSKVVADSIATITVGNVLGGTMYFDGDIADVAVWQAELTAEEIDALQRGIYARNIQPRQLLHNWRFEEHLRDLTGGAHFTHSGTATYLATPSFFAHVKNLDLTTPAVERTPVIDITLSGSTLRYSDRTKALSDNTQYLQRVLGFPRISLSIGRILDPLFARTAMRFTLDNSDDVVREAFDANDGFASSAIALKLIVGNDATLAATLASGYRQFPGGAEWDDSRFSLTVEQPLRADMRSLPKNKFFPSDYPHADLAVLFQPIPWIWGDWRSTADPPLTVPCYRVNANTGTGGAFKIAEKLQSIESVYKNGEQAGYTVTDGTAGEFTLDETFDPLTDVVTAHVLGPTTATHTGAGSEFSLTRIVYDLLTSSDLLNISTARINDAAFSRWASDLYYTANCRRWLGTETSSATLLAELMSDGFADMVINQSGEYTPVYRKRAAAASAITLKDADLLRGASGKRDFRVLIDPEITYANVITGVYAKHASTSTSYANATDQEATNAISASGQRRRRQLTMNWLYSPDGAEARASLEMAVFSREVEQIEIGVGARGLALYPGDQFGLQYSKYDVSGAPTIFQVREVEYDVSNFTARIRAWNINSLTSGYWTSGTGSPWSTATDSEKATQGFWTDADGYADAADTTSNKSKWF